MRKYICDLCDRIIENDEHVVKVLVPVDGSTESSAYAKQIEKHLCPSCKEAIFSTYVVTSSNSTGIDNVRDAIGIMRYHD